jgi:hypothetical protein
MAKLQKFPKLQSYTNFINEDLGLKNNDGILLIVDVQKEFGDYIPDNMVKELFEYCKEFKDVYQIWDSHDAVAPTFKFPNQKSSINKKFGKKFLEKDVQNKLEKLKNGSIEGQQIQIDSDDIFVRVKNNHDWFFINDQLLKLFNQLKGKKIIVVGGADFECLKDVFIACKSMGVKAMLNHKYIYSAETKKEEITENFIFKANDKSPEIFQKTIYRLPTQKELENVNKFNLSTEDILNGFVYTIVGRGIKDTKNKQMIINSIQKLCDLFPDNNNYTKALDLAKNMSLKIF